MTSLEDLKKDFVTDYMINANTPSGRINWAVNDFLNKYLLTKEQKELIFFATDEEVKSWA